ncbi:MAG TPA: PAS domain S-box protein, partial [Candidatus Cloacimonetes bacterium]|nr:PAS domain S-box protein [Candidatus Cloacimonadota bacterium]
EALLHLEIGRKISHEIGAKDLEKESFEGLSKLYSATGKYEKAYEFINRYTELKDSIFAIEKSLKITHLQNKYEAEKTENLISAMKKEQEIQNLIKKYLIIGLILILLITILLYYLYNEKKKEIVLRKKTEERLIESEESFRSLAENLKVSVFTFDESGYFTYANPASSEISGYSNKELLSMKFYEFVHPEFKETVKERGFSRLEEDIYPNTYEIKIITKNKVQKWIELVNSRIIINGKAVILGTGVNITENKKAREIQTVLYNISNATNTTTEIDELYKIIHEQLNTIIDTTNFYIALYDEKTNIISAPYYIDELNKQIPEPQQLKNGITAYIIKKEKPLYLTAKKRNKLIREGLIADMNWKSKIWLGVPLKVGKNVIGALAVQSYKDAKMYSEKDLEILEFVSEQVALAIDRKKAQDALKESIVRNKALLQAIPDMIFVLDKNGKYLDFEAEKNGLLAIPRKQIIGKNIKDAGFNEQQIKLILNKIEESIKTGNTQTIEYELAVPEGLNTFEARIVPLNQSKVLAIVRDVTSQRKAEKGLIESEERYRRLFDSSPDPIIVHSNGKLISANKAAANFIGIDNPEKLYGQPIIDFVAPESHEIVKERIHKLYTAGTPVELEEEKYLTIDGSVRDVEISAIPITFKNEKAVLVAFRDITDRKSAEERIKNSLKEKEVLLQEIHHRVKNNMQVISSMLNLQAGYIKNKQDLDLFKDSINRVKSMALIHEKLYRSEDLARINFSDYIQKLARNLFTFFKIDINRIKYRVEMEEILLDINKAIPCGLIINELLSNSLKYAFPKDKKGLIQIKIEYRENENKYHVLFEDDGIGLPDRIDFQNTETLGLQLVTTLVKQLHGDIELDKSNGSKYTIIFTGSDDV